MAIPKWKRNKRDKKSFVNKKKLADLQTKFNIMQISSITAPIELPKREEATVLAGSNCDVNSLKTSEKNPENLIAKVSIEDSTKPFTLEYSYKTAGVARKAEVLTYKLKGFKIKRVN